MMPSRKALRQSTSNKMASTPALKDANPSPCQATDKGPSTSTNRSIRFWTGSRPQNDPEVSKAVEQYIRSGGRSFSTLSVNRKPLDGSSSIRVDPSSFQVHCSLTPEKRSPERKASSSKKPPAVSPASKLGPKCGKVGKRPANHSSINKMTQAANGAASKSTFRSANKHQSKEFSRSATVSGLNPNTFHSGKNRAILTVKVRKTQVAAKARGPSEANENIRSGNCRKTNGGKARTQKNRGNFTGQRRNTKKAAKAQGPSAANANIPPTNGRNKNGRKARNQNSGNVQYRHQHIFPAVPQSQIVYLQPLAYPWPLPFVAKPVHPSTMDCMMYPQTVCCCRCGATCGHWNQSPHAR